MTQTNNMHWSSVHEPVLQFEVCEYTNFTDVTVYFIYVFGSLVYRSCSVHKLFRLSARLVSEMWQLFRFRQRKLWVLCRVYSSRALAKLFLADHACCSTSHQCDSNTNIIRSLERICFDTKYLSKYLEIFCKYIVYSYNIFKNFVFVTILRIAILIWMHIDLYTGDSSYFCLGFTGKVCFELLFEILRAFPPSSCCSMAP